MSMVSAKGIDAKSRLVVHLSPVCCLWRRHLSIQWFATATTVGEASIVMYQLATPNACSMDNASMIPVSVTGAGPELIAILVRIFIFQFITLLRQAWNLIWQFGRGIFFYPGFLMLSFSSLIGIIPSFSTSLNSFLSSPSSLLFWAP